MAFRPGAEEVVTAYQSSELLGVWNYAGGGARAIPNVGRVMPQLLAVLPDDRVLLGNGQRLYVVAPSEPGPPRIVPVPDGVGPRSLAVVNAGRRVACACGDGTIRVWDAASWQQVARVDAPGVRTLAATAAGDRGGVAFADGTIRELRFESAR